MAKKTGGEDELDAYFQQVWAKLQAAVKEGKMSAKDAEAKMAAIKKAKLGGGKRGIDYEAIGKEIRAAVAAGKLLQKDDPDCGKNAEHPRQKCRSECGKSAHSLRQIRVTTRNTTRKETRNQTIAPPSPLPAGGQAPAVLAERKRAVVQGIEKFKKQFGIGKKPHQPLSEKEIQDRRQIQLKALLAGEL